MRIQLTKVSLNLSVKQSALDCSKSKPVRLKFRKVLFVFLGIKLCKVFGKLSGVSALYPFSLPESRPFSCFLNKNTAPLTFQGDDYE